MFLKKNILKESEEWQLRSKEKCKRKNHEDKTNLIENGWEGKAKEKYSAEINCRQK